MLVAIISVLNIMAMGLTNALLVPNVQNTTSVIGVGCAFLLMELDPTNVPVI